MSIELKLHLIQTDCKIFAKYKPKGRRLQHQKTIALITTQQTECMFNISQLGLEPKHNSRRRKNFNKTQKNLQQQRVIITTINQKLWEWAKQSSYYNNKTTWKNKRNGAKNKNSNNKSTVQFQKLSGQK